MNVIQSYSLISNNPHNDNKLSTIYSNLYTFLLSYLTIKKNVGPVTMYCDELAYELLVQYIPYDKVIIKENPYKDVPRAWSMYKLEVIEVVKCPYLHFDCDVFIYNKMLNEYINDDSYNMLVQQIDYGEDCYDYVIKTYNENKQFFIDNNIMTKDIKLGFTSGCFNSIKTEDTKKHYLNICKKLIDLQTKESLHYYGYASIIEEFAYYILTYNTKYYSILDNIGDSFYTNHMHLHGKMKFKMEHINWIKQYIIGVFPEHAYLIGVYETLINNNLTINDL